MLQLLSPFRTSHRDKNQALAKFDCAKHFGPLVGCVLPWRKAFHACQLPSQHRSYFRFQCIKNLGSSPASLEAPQPASKLLPFPVHEKPRTFVTPVIPVITEPWVAVGDVLVRSPVTKLEDIKNDRAKWRSKQVRLCLSPALKLLKESRPGGVTMISTHGEKNVYACKNCRERVLCIGETMRKLDGDLRQLIWDVRSVTPCNCS